MTIFVGEGGGLVTNFPRGIDLFEEGDGLFSGRREGCVVTILE